MKSESQTPKNVILLLAKINLPVGASRRRRACTCHSDYYNSLRLTGSALSTFAASEPLAVFDDIPAVFVNTVKTHKQPPPPPATVTTTKLCTFSETCRLKLPHILSNSSICSICSTPRSEFPNWFIQNYLFIKKLNYFIKICIF
ncbi:hypothetical protein MtrunA17_Chr8g0341331 [Medicago truncatula]|uniref:Uncharacterized protein n=1 Tax=Medicago truncatula TaxID=3880 RepID=A0A396GHZ5_MEDTR|nr:hypothetical protein MtrunA17_Chr8g0341331 [Medicago truncatula]